MLSTITCTHIWALYACCSCQQASQIVLDVELSFTLIRAFDIVKGTKLCVVIMHMALCIIRSAGVSAKYVYIQFRRWDFQPFVTPVLNR